MLHLETSSVMGKNLSPLLSNSLGVNILEFTVVFPNCSSSYAIQRHVSPNTNAVSVYFWINALNMSSVFIFSKIAAFLCYWIYLQELMKDAWCEFEDRIDPKNGKKISADRTQSSPKRFMNFYSSKMSHYRVKKLIFLVLMWWVKHTFVIAGRVYISCTFSWKWLEANTSVVLTFTTKLSLSSLLVTIVFDYILTRFFSFRSPMVRSLARTHNRHGGIPEV